MIALPHRLHTCIASRARFGRSLSGENTVADFAGASA
jgi:hypothetical protein